MELKGYKVQWHEGMLLNPQHFQQQDSIFSNHISSLYNFQATTSFGLIDFHYNADLLAKGIVSLQSLQAIMPNGQYVNVNDTSADFMVPNYSFENIHLKLGENLLIGIFINENPTSYSFESFVKNNIADQTDPSNVISINFLKPKITIATSKNVPANSVGVYFLKITKTINAFEISDTFLPPYIKIPLNHKIRSQLSLICKNLREKYSYFFDRSSDHKMITQNISGYLLSVLCMLEPLIAQEKLSPYVLFENIKMALAFLLPSQQNKVPGVFVTFTPQNPHESIAPYLEHLDFLTTQLEQDYTVVPFLEQDRLFYLHMLANYCSNDYLITLRFPEDLDAFERQSWIDNAVIASDEFIKTVTSHRITGASRKVLSALQKQSISSAPNIVAISLSNSDPYIKPNQNLNIFNPGDTPQTRPLDMALYLKTDS